jgi:hypothetical protein
VDVAVLNSFENLVKNDFPIIINAELCEGEEFLFYPSAAASFHLDTDNFFIDSATTNYNNDENDASNIFEFNFIPPIALPVACVNEPVTAALTLSDTEAREIVYSTVTSSESKNDDDFEKFECEIASSCEYLKEITTCSSAFPPSAQQAKENRQRAMQRWLAKKKKQQQSKPARPQTNSLNPARRAATSKRERDNSGKFKRNKLWISLTSWDDFQQQTKPTTEVSSHQKNV